MWIIRQTIKRDHYMEDPMNSGGSTYRGGESCWNIGLITLHITLEYYKSGWKYTRNGVELPCDWREAHHLLDTYTGLTPAGIWLEAKLKNWQDSYRESSEEIQRLKSEFESMFLLHSVE